MAASRRLTAVANSSDVALCGRRVTLWTLDRAVGPRFSLGVCRRSCREMDGCLERTTRDHLSFFNNLKYRSDSCRGVSDEALC